MERRLAALAEASARIFTAQSMGESLRLITEEARTIIGAHQSVTSLTVGDDWAQAIQSVSLSEKYAAWRGFDRKPSGKGIYAAVCRENRPMRFTQAELEAHAGWRGLGAAKGSHPPPRGWLAAPLVGRDGANLGLVQLSDKYEGEFDAEDESLLVQLARLAALAVENIRLIEKAQSAERRFQEFAKIGSQVLWETDAEHRYTLFLTQPSFRMRRSPASFIGKTRWEAVGIDPTTPPWPDYMAQIAAQRPIRNFEYTTPSPDGMLYHLRLNADPMFDTAGRFAGYRGTTQDVTDLRRAEAAARASEARFRSFAEGTSDWFWETDANHRFSCLSPVSEGVQRAPDETILGYTRWELAGADPAHPKWAAHIADIEAHRPFRDFEYSPRQPDGSILYLRISGQPYFAADGSFQGFRGTVTDVTRQREAEAAALKAAEQYRRIVETANEGVWILDADVRTIFVNRRMAEMLGYAAEEIVGRSVYDFRPPEDRVRRESRWTERKQGVAEEREARFCRRDGTVFWALVSAQPLFDANGAFAGSLGMVTDITARKEADAALKASQERFRDFAEVGSDWLWESDAEHRIVFLDGPAPVAADLALGKRRWEYGNVDAEAPLWRRHRQDLALRLPFRNFEYTIRGTQGESRHFSISGKPVFDANGQFTGYRGTTRDVTARHQAEAKAREADEQFRRLVSTANEGIWITDSEARLVFANRRVAEMYGYQPDEMIGKELYDFIPADRIEEARRHWSERRAGKVDRFEARHRRKDGSEVWALVSTTPTHDADGTFTGAITMFIDVTDRKRAEAALAASEERFRDFAEIASDWMWETDTEHRLAYISGAIQIDNQPLGRTRWELAGAPPDDPAWRGHIADLEARRPFREFEFAVGGNSGRLHHLATSGHPKFDKAGNFLGYRGTTSNRTAQREAEQAAHASEQKFQHIVDTANEGVWLIDQAGKTTYANRRLCEMLGYSPEELAGRSLLDLKPPEDRAETAERWEKAGKGGMRRFETRFRRKDGQDIWVFLSSTPMLDEGGRVTGAFGMVVDITERKRAEAAQAASEQRFRDFASVASDWFWETDGEHRFSYFSPSRELSQLDPSAGALGLTRWEYARGDLDDPAWTAHFADLAARRPFRNFEYKYRRPDGSVGTSVVNGVPVFGAAGAFIGYRGTAADVTAQRAVEAAARENERKFRLFIETANEGVWMVDAGMNTVYVNHRISEMLGYAPEEMLGRSYLDFKYPEEVPTAQHHWELTQQRGLGRTEVRLRRKDGSELWVLLSDTRQLDEAGRFVGAFAMLVDITDRRRAEEAAARAKREVDAILASISDGFIALDNDWRYTYVNPAAERITGRTEKAAVGFNITNLLADDPDNVFINSYVAAKRDGEPVAFTAYSDVFRLWLEVRAYPHAEGLTLFFRDVTAERQSHLALAESERKLRAALERNQSILASISDGFVALDNEWRFTFINQAAERLWHRKAEELLGKTILDALNIDPSNPFQSSYLESKRTGEPVALTAYSALFGKWIEVRGYPHPGGYTIFFDDVTDERTAHRALLKSQKKLQAAREMNERIFESSFDLICITDRQGNFIQVNPGTVQQFGHPLEELIGHNASEFIHPDGIEATRAALQAAKRSRKLHTFENRCLRKDGHAVPIHWSVAWSDREQKYFLIGRDMTERLEAEERLNRSQRLEAIGQLTGGIAHDFNNLLTVIMGNSDMLARALKDRATLRRQAELSLEAARRAAELTAQLLAFARRQTLAPKAVEPNKLVTDLQELVGRTLGAQIDIALRLEPKPWLCKVDSTQLETALLNLALNARDAMPEGGTLAIATSNRTVAAGGIGTAAELPSGDYVVIDVADTGAGMAPEVMARAFEPFFTTKDIGKGSGLGLAMVYGFAKQSGGHVAIESEVGRGTTVSLYLPRATEETLPTAPPAPRDDTPFPGGLETILVVEDDPAVRELVTDALRRLGYRVLVAGNGATARNILFGGEKVDLLFTDIMMPGGVTGAQLAAEAESRIPGLRILFTTGYSEAPLMKQAKTGVSLLRKPYRTRELALTVRRALDDAA